MKKSKFKPLLLSYDWKESIDQVIKDLEPFLKKVSVFLLIDPMSIGSDSYGYILTDNPKMTVGEYRKLLESEYSDCNEWLEDVLKENKLTDKDRLSKLIEALS